VWYHSGMNPGQVQGKVTMPRAEYQRYRQAAAAEDRTFSRWALRALRAFYRSTAEPSRKKS